MADSDGEPLGTSNVASESESSTFDGTSMWIVNGQNNTAVKSLPT